MTAQEIADRYLTSPKGQTAERLAKAQALAKRSNVPWVEVKVLLPAEIPVQPEA